jgi:hypothetical protein
LKGDRYELAHNTSRHSIGGIDGDIRDGERGLGMGDVNKEAKQAANEAVKYMIEMQSKADAFAKVNGGDKAHFITDAWGGYWQTATENGPYNFRLTPPASPPKPGPLDTPSS